MKYAVDMGSSTMIYIPSFINAGSGIQNLIRGNTQTHRQHGDRISVLSIFFYIRKGGLWDHYLICMSVYFSYQFLNAWTNLYETWYVRHDTWTHPNGVRYKSLLSVCVSLWVSPFVAVRGLVDPMTIVRLEGWGQSKIPMASSRLELATSRPLV
jgi:hypothetical protein